MGLLTSMKYPFALWAELAEGSSFLDEKPRSVKFERHMTAERTKAIDGEGESWSKEGISCKNFSNQLIKALLYV